MHEKKSQNIEIELISSQMLKNMNTREKIREIIDSVTNDKIVILEEGLTPEEESKLIERVMNTIDPNSDSDFSGIEIETYPEEKTESGILGRLMNSDDNSSEMTLIGPENKLETESSQSIIKAKVE